MLQAMKSRLAVILMFLVSTVYAGDTVLLHASEWAVPKQASTILSIPSIHKVMQEIQTTNNSILKIRYPGGDEGTLWANELRGWLVALGLSSKRIELIPGGTISATIELEVVTTKKQNQSTVIK